MSLEGEWPRDDTSADFSFHDEPEESRSPLALVALCSFFAADSLERWGEVGWHVLEARSQNQPWAESLSPWHPWLPAAVLWAAVSGSVAALLWARTSWSRWIGMMLLFAHLAYMVHVLAINQPTLWLYMSEWGRVRVLASALLDVGALVWLGSREARTYLDRD